MKKLDVRFTRSPGDEIAVGTLAHSDHQIYFEYDDSFLDVGWSLSPWRLPPGPRLIQHTNREFGPLPGLFDDSLPDGWGLLLMDRHYRQHGHDPATISPLDRLAWLGRTTMGALTYHPPTHADESPATAFDLGELAQQSARILAGSAHEVLPELLRAGGSPGGARPKVLIGYDPTTDTVISGVGDLPPGFEAWIVKFTAGEDSDEWGAVEYAYSLMAGAAGLSMPETRLFAASNGGRYFGVRRFDRGTIADSAEDHNRRYHVHTFGNLIEADFRVPSADYGDLLRATSLLTRNHQDVRRACRQMVFNVLAHNRDDHVKNFAFLFDDTHDEWTLSPAYDVVYSSGPGGEHTMTVAGEGKTPGIEQFRRVCEVVGVDVKELDATVAEVRDAIGRWDEFAASAGVNSAIRREIADRI